MKYLSVRYEQRLRLIRKHGESGIVTHRTDEAQLKLSSHGLYRKVVIRLRADESSRSDFQREMNTLFDEELIGRYL